VSGSPKEPGFDRLRRRAADRSDEPLELPDTVPDQEGKRLLFSAADQPAAYGSFTIDCSDCSVRSVVSAAQVLRLALPSLHLPGLRRDHWSYMRCPACRRRAWVRVGLQI